MKKILSLTLIIFIIKIFAAEGYYIKQEIRTPQMNSQPARSITTETYISGNRVKTTNKHSIIFLDNQKYEAYDPWKKNYSTADISDFSANGKALNDQFAGFKIKKTDTKVKIGKWNTEKYIATVNVSDINMEIDIYITHEINIPSDIPFKQQEIMYPDAENIKEMIRQLKKIGGLQIKSVIKINMDNTKYVTTTEVKEVKKLTAEEVDKAFIKPVGFEKLN